MKVENEHNRHLKGLKSLLNECGNTTDAAKIYRLLSRIEKRQYENNVKFANGEISGFFYEKRTQKRENEVKSLFNGKLKGFFINRDPRGYALKIEGGNYELLKDSGGFYVLAPDFEQETL